MDFSEAMLELARRKAPRLRFEAGNALELPLRRRRVRRRHRGIRRAQLRRPRRGPVRDGARGAARGAGGGARDHHAPAPAAVVVLPAVVRPAGAGPRPPGGRLRRLHLPAELGAPLPRPRRSSGRELARAGLTDVRWVLTAGGHHRDPLRHGRRRGRERRRRRSPRSWRRAAPSSPTGCARTEARLAEVADGHGAELGRHASGTLAAGGKRLRPVLVFLCGRLGRRPAARPRRRSSCCTWPRSSTTTCSTAPRCAGASRRCSPPAAAAAAVATGDLLFSRAFAELRLTGSEPAVAALSEASSALARGELMQRADAWSDSVTAERYLERCELKTASLFAAAAGWARCSGTRRARRDADALAGFGRRIGLAFQILDDVLDVSGPAERTGKHRGTDLLDGTVTLPLILARGARPGAGGDGPARGRLRARAGRGRVRPHRRAPGRWARRARRRCTTWPRRRRRCTGLELPDSRRRALRPGGRRRGGALRLEVFGQDRVGVERRHEAVDLFGHVGAAQAPVVGGEGVGAQVELLVEGVDGALVEDALAARARTRGSAGSPPSCSLPASSQVTG